MGYGEEVPEWGCEGGPRFQADVLAVAFDGLRGIEEVMALIDRCVRGGDDVRVKELFFCLVTSVISIFASM